MKKLSVGQVVVLHEILIKYSGGADGIRDVGLLESALAAPFSSFGGVSVYPTLQSKAARLAFGIIKNHPFVDGNKRVGILAMISFLEINGVKLNCTDDELIKIGLGLADGTIDEKSALDFIIEHG
ncbi:MAG: type II toxin-antitoxin system death-on-curing family toxin [Oscillospiraceae bacterium]|jgi:death-on-curing protein|nr:type II toxin-antitoxin system death-on-curing family toxin [Oscillospiraceae bacterium]